MFLLRVLKVISWAIGGAALAMLLLTAIAFAYVQTWVGGRFVGSMVQTVIRENLGLDATIGSIRVNFFKATVDVEGLSLSDGKNPPIAKVGKVSVTINPILLLARRLVIQNISVESPEGHLIIKDGRLENLPDFKKLKGGGTVSSPSGTELKVEVEKVTVRKGVLRLDVPGHAEAEIRGIRLDVAKAGDLYDLSFKTRRFMVKTPAGELKDVMLVALGTVSPEGVKLKKLKVAIGKKDGYIKLMGAVNGFDAPVLDGVLELKLPLDLLKHGGPGFPGGSGMVRLDAKLTGPVAMLEASGSLLVRKGSVGQFSLGDISTEFDFKKDTIDITAMRIVNQGTDLSLTASLGLSGDLPVTADVRLAKLQLHRLLDNLGAHNNSHVELDIAGRIRAQGTLGGEGGPRLFSKLDLRTTNLKVLPVSWRQSATVVPILALASSVVQGDTELTADRIAMKTGRVLVGPDTITIDGSWWSFSETTGMKIDARTRHLDIKPVGTLAGFAISGDGPLTCLIEGPYNEPRIDGRADFAGVSFAGFKAGKAQLNVRLRGEVLALDPIEGNVDGMEYAGGITIDLTKAVSLSAHLRTSDAPLGGVFSVFGVPFLNDSAPAGKVSLDGWIEGPPGRLSGELKAGLAGGSFYGQKIDRIDAEFKSLDGDLSVKHLDIVNEGSKTAISGTIMKNGDMNLTLRTSGVRLSQITYTRFRKYPVDATAELWASVGGTVWNPTVVAGLSLNGASVGANQFLPSYVDLNIKDRRLDTVLNMFGGAVKIKAGGHMGGRWPFDLEGNVSDFQWPLLIPGGEGYKGTITAVVTLSGDLADFGHVSGGVDLGAFGFEAPGLKIALKEAARVDLADGRISMTPMSFTGDGFDFQLHSGGLVGGRGSVLAEGKVGLKLLEMLGRDTIKAEGAADFTLKINAAIDSLDISGNVMLEGGRLQFAGFPHPFENLSFKAYISGGKVRFDEIRAVVGEGRLTGSGQMAMDMFVPRSFKLTADVRGANLKIPSYLPSRVSGSVRLDGDLSSVTLSGDLNIEEATFTDELNWDKLLLEMKRKRIVVQTFDKEKEILRFDLGLHGDSGLRIRNNLVDAELKANLHLTGSTQRIGLIGTVSAINGRLNFMSSQFLLRSALIQFKDRYRIAYSVDVQADSSCYDSANRVDHPIKLQVSGDSGDIKMSYRDMYSPPFSETDIVTCLTLGMTSDQLAKGKDVGLGLLTSVSGLDNRMRSIASPIAIETFRITQAYSQTTGTTVPSVQVTWRLLGELRLSYSSALMNNLDQRFDVDYKLSRVVALHANVARNADVQVGDIGADLKLRWEF